MTAVGCIIHFTPHSSGFGTLQYGRIIKKSSVCGPCRECHDLHYQVCGSRHDRQLGDVFRGDSLIGGYRQPGLAFAWYAAGRLEVMIAQLDKKIKETFPKVKRVFVEAESRRAMMT